MRNLLHWLGGILAAAIAGYFLWAATNALRLQDLYALTSGSTIAAIVFAALMYTLIIPISGIAWAVLLRRYGEAWPARHLATILAVAQLAKYIPGGIAQPLGRGVLSSRLGVKLRPLAVSMVQESVLTIAASTAVGTSMLAISPRGVEQIPLTYQSVALFGTLLAGAAVLVVACGSMLLPEIIRRQRWISRILDAIGPALGPRATLIALCAYGANYILIGVGIWAIGQALGLGANGSYSLLTAAFALGWLIGFVVPGAPAGLGVREGAMSIVLANGLSQHHIVDFVLAVRVATLAGDGICFGLGVYSLRRMNRGRVA